MFLHCTWSNVFVNSSPSHRKTGICVYSHFFRRAKKLFKAFINFVLLSTQDWYMCSMAFSMQDWYMCTLCISVQYWYMCSILDNDTPWYNIVSICHNRHTVGIFGMKGDIKSYTLALENRKNLKNWQSYGIFCVSVRNFLSFHAFFKILLPNCSSQWVLNNKCTP